MQILGPETKLSKGGEAYNNHLNVNE